MNAQKRGQIRELAERIRVALELTPPINMEEVVARLGGEIEYTATAGDQFEAMVQKTEGSFKISMSRLPSSPRQKFTLAHEVGHLFLHMGYLVNQDKWDSITDYRDSARYRYGYSEEELEANEFAGTFLMPKEMFEQVAEKNLRDGKYNVTAIAQEFGVSVDAAKIRGRLLGLFSWD